MFHESSMTHPPLKPRVSLFNTWFPSTTTPTFGACHSTFSTPTSRHSHAVKHQQGATACPDHEHAVGFQQRQCDIHRTLSCHSLCQSQHQRQCQGKCMQMRDCNNRNGRLPVIYRYRWLRALAMQCNVAPLPNFTIRTRWTTRSCNHTNH